MENLTNPVSRIAADAEHILERLRRLAAELGVERACAMDLMFLARHAHDPAAARALRVAVGLFERLLEARPPRRRITITAAQARAALATHGSLRRAARALGVSAQTVMRSAKFENTCSMEQQTLPPSRDAGR